MKKGWTRYLFILIVLMVVSAEGTALGVSVGKEGTINADGGYTPVAISEVAFDEWTKARVAKDKHGQVLLMAAGKVVLAEGKTRVLVIDQAFLRRKIRILEGDYEGLAGWISEELVK